LYKKQTDEAIASQWATALAGRFVGQIVDPTALEPEMRQTAQDRATLENEISQYNQLSPTIQRWDSATANPFQSSQAMDANELARLNALAQLAGMNQYGGFQSLLAPPPQPLPPQSVQPQPQEGMARPILF
jgi:hypothetical protein